MGKRKRKKTETEILKERSDTVWSAAVKADWNHTCAMCGRRGNLNSHHIIPRQFTATRHDLANGICLCGHCHSFDRDRAPHQNPEGWKRWLSERYPLQDAWCKEMHDCGDHKRLISKGIPYYVDILRGLRQYVDEDTFTRILGAKRAAWLDEQAA